MIKAGDFLAPCFALGYGFFTGTPCSYLKPFINYVIEYFSTLIVINSYSI